MSFKCSIRQCIYSSTGVAQIRCHPTLCCGDVRVSCHVQVTLIMKPGAQPAQGCLEGVVQAISAMHRKLGGSGCGVPEPSGGGVAALPQNAAFLALRGQALTVPDTELSSRLLTLVSNVQDLQALLSSRQAKVLPQMALTAAHTPTVNTRCMHLCSTHPARRRRTCEGRLGFSPDLMHCMRTGG